MHYPVQSITEQYIFRSYTLQSNSLLVDLMHYTVQCITEQYIVRSYTLQSNTLLVDLSRSYATQQWQISINWARCKWTCYQPCHQHHHQSIIIPISMSQHLWDGNKPQIYFCHPGRATEQRNKCLWNIRTTTNKVIPLRRNAYYATQSYHPGVAHCMQA